MLILNKEIEIKGTGNKLIVIGINNLYKDFFINNSTPFYAATLQKNTFALYYRQGKSENYFDDIVIIESNFTKDCKILGRVTDLNEEQVKNFVSFLPKQSVNGITYQNYLNPSVVTYPFETALESFYSFLKFYNCFIKDWIKKPDVGNYNSAQEVWDHYEGEYEDWNQLPENLLIIYKPEI